MNYYCGSQTKWLLINKMSTKKIYKFYLMTVKYSRFSLLIVEIALTMLKDTYFLMLSEMEMKYLFMNKHIFC